MNNDPIPIRQYETIINGQRVTVKVYAPDTADGAQTAESWRQFDFGLERIPIKGGYQTGPANQIE